MWAQVWISRPRTKAAAYGNRNMQDVPDATILSLDDRYKSP
jgi:hypothetical protein